MAVVIVLLCLFNIGMWVVFLIRFKALFSTTGILKSTRNSLDSMLKELNSNADRNITLIEDRINTLQKVSAEADKRVAFLRDELSKAQKSMVTHAEAYEIPTETKKKESVKKPRSQPRRRTTTPLQTYIDNKNEGKKGGQELPENTAGPTIYPAKEQIHVEKDMKTQLKELAELGYTDEEIAAKLDISTQEVKLILEFS